MSAPKFNNTPNEHIQLRYKTSNHGNIGLDYWVSRAPAVVGVVIATCSDLVGTIHNNYAIMNFLITKRSSNMRDEPNKFGVPCGYLDWDETGYMGMVREVYEETSLYLPDYEKFKVFDNFKQPYFIQTDPAEDKHQNISLMYVTVLDFKNDLDSFPQYVSQYKDKETAEVRWMNLYEFHNSNLEWAFNHDKRIMGALNYYMNT